MDDDQYGDWLASGGWEDKAEHSTGDMENPKNHTDDHHVQSHSEDSFPEDRYDELYGDLIDPYGDYEAPEQEDDQYPDDNTSTPDPDNTKNWYLDKDGDGYDGGTESSDTSPGAGWIEGTSKGPDCDDTKIVLTTTALLVQKN